MTPRERILATLRGQNPDRVPIILHGLSFASHDALKNLGDPFRKKLAERVIDETDFKVQVPSFINRMLITPPQRIKSENKVLPNGNRQSFGIIDTPLGELTFITEWDPTSGTSWQVKYPVETYEDIKKIASVLWERPERLLPPNMDSLPKEFPERGVLCTHISSPFVCVSAMMSYEWFLELCFLDLELMKELTDICLNRTLDCLEVLFSKPGIEYVWIGGSEWITPPMAPPVIYDALVQEQEKTIIQYIHKNSDSVVHIHCHGRIRNALLKTIERHGDYTEPVEPPPDGDITMAEAKKMSAGRITLGGNVECRILCNESEDAVEKAVHEAFEGGKERFILTTTAEHSPKITQQEFNNYMRMIDLWEELSLIG